MSLGVNHRAFSTEMVDVLYRGGYEIEEVSILRRTLEPNDRLLEVGGGIGFTALIANEILRSPDQLLVVEANPKLILEMERNFAENRVRLTVMNCLLGHEEREGVPFYVHDDFWRSSLLPSPGSREIVVRQVNVRRVLAEFRPTYLVVDIEGSEVDLLKDLELEGVTKLCIELHPGATGLQATNELVSHLLHRGFNIDFHKSWEAVLYLSR